MSQLDTSSHGEVYLSCKQVSAQWRELAIRLGLEKSTIDIIKANNVGDVEGCMYEVIDKWLKRDVRKGVDCPSWKSLCIALSHIDGPLAEVSKVADQSGVSPVFLPFSCGCGQCTIRGWMTGHSCRQNIVYTDSAHPKLVQIFEKDNPLFYELQSSCYRATLANETRYLTDCFRDIRIETWRGLEQLVEEGKYSVADFVFKLNAWLDGKPFPMATNLIELQHHLHSICVTWFNYGPLEYLAKTFLSKNPTLMTNWNEYYRTLQDYCSIRDLRSRFVSVFFNLPVEGQNVFSLEVDEFLYDFTLADVKYLSNSLSRALGIPSVCLHLVTIGTGSLLIYFYYCYSDYLVMFKALTTQQLQIISQIKTYRILSLTDLHNRFTYDNIQNDQDEADEAENESEMKNKKMINMLKEIELLKGKLETKEETMKIMLNEIEHLKAEKMPMSKEMDMLKLTKAQDNDQEEPSQNEVEGKKSSDSTSSILTSSAERPETTSSKTTSLSLNVPLSVTTPPVTIPSPLAILSSTTTPYNQEFDTYKDDPQLYRAYLFYKKIAINNWDIEMVVIKQNSVHMKFITNMFAEEEQICSFGFRFTGPSEAIELNFPNRDRLPTGWIITPLTIPCSVSKEDIDSLSATEVTVLSHEQQSLYCDIPMCKASVHAEDSPSTASHIAYCVEITGIQEKKSVVIARRKSNTSPAGAVSGAVTSDPLSRSIEAKQDDDENNDVVTVEQMKDSVKRAIQKKYPTLKTLFDINIRAISAEMIAQDITTSHNTKTTFDKIISDFYGGMDYQDDIEELRDWCNRFFTAMIKMGGPLKLAAEKLKKSIKHL